MKKILIIELSATLRHALETMLSQNGYESLCINSFEEAATHLTNAKNCTEYDAVLFSWPVQTDTENDELLMRLTDSPFSELPLIVLAHEPDPAKLSWVASRQHSAFLLWDNHTDIVESLNVLFEETKSTDTAIELPHTQIRVLLVDDSPTARVKFRRLLEAQGYQTDTASCVSEGFNKACSQKYDIAVIDYFMPDNTGDVLCQKLRSNPSTANITMAILTSTYLDKVITNSLSAGAEEVMFKNEADELFVARVNAMSRTVLTTKRINTDRNRLECILTSVGDGVIGINKDKLITFNNPAVNAIMGFDHDTLLSGIEITEIFHQQQLDNKKARSYLQQVNQAIEVGQEFYGIESEFIRKDGTPIQVELTIFPLHTDDHPEGAVIAFRDVSERKLLVEELRWQANHDPLTKLINRKYIEDTLEQEVLRLKRSNDKSALLYIDLDRFKYINDTLGHIAGDQVLIEIGHQLQTRIRRSDILARFGGDEFVILLHDIKEDTLFDTVTVFRELMSNYKFIWEGNQYSIHGSIGVAIIDKHAASHGEMLANADIACHIAKGEGRNCIHIYSAEQDDKVNMELELGWSNRLLKALEKNTFNLVFQPIIPLHNIDTKNIPDTSGELWQSYVNQTHPEGIMYEVLLRLENNSGSAISPYAFLPTAERFNMMLPIDTWVIDSALNALNQYSSQGYKTQLTINLSGQTLDSPEIVDTITDCFKLHNIDPKLVLFEITETVAINKIESARLVISKLQALGCRFALDDFGSGYCSFSHLKNLPVDFIKIDGQFVKDFMSDPMDRAIVTSIHNIAHSLGKKTIAEFVEDAETMRILKDIGIDYVQGYYLSHPLNILPSYNLKTSQDTQAS